MRPLLITFEGLDGSGKSTHLKRVAERLAAAGVPVEATHEPGGTPLGEAIRAIFLDPRWRDMEGTVEALLVFASRRQHLLEVIDPALAAGRHVLCDRFTDSTMVYQGRGSGAPEATLRAIDEIATGGRQPDLTLLFDLSPEAGRSRRHGSSSKRGSGDEADRFDAEAVDFYRRLRQGYLDLAARHPDRFRIIDSSGTKEETEEQVLRVLAPLLPGSS